MGYSCNACCKVWSLLPAAVQPLLSVITESVNSFVARYFCCCSTSKQCALQGQIQCEKPSCFLMTCGFLPPLPFFSELSSFCCSCISAFSYVQGPNTLSPSAKIAPGALLTPQGWFVVSSSSGRAGCGGLPAAGKKLWEPQWPWGRVV